MAKAWGMTPMDWRQQSTDDRALMMAYEMFVETCEGYRAEWHRDKGDRKGRKLNPGGLNPYQEMLKNFGM